jgi:hypothetical protein
MYAVVGCNNCRNLWLVSDPDDAETAQCSRCGKRHQLQKLRRFHETDDHEAARQARATLLAQHSDAGDSFADVDSVAEMESQLDAVGISDEELLAGSGLDPEAVADAAESATEGVAGSRSREERIRDGFQEIEDPTVEAVVDYAVEHGVPADAARDHLERLRRHGDITEHGGTLRLL